LVWIGRDGDESRATRATDLSRRIEGHRAKSRRVGVLAASGQTARRDVRRLSRQAAGRRAWVVDGGVVAARHLGADVGLTSTAGVGLATGLREEVVGLNHKKT